MSEMPPWVETRMEYDASNNLKFTGKHKGRGALSSDTGWYITRYFWDASSNLTQKIGPVIGIWNDRASLIP